MTNANAFLNSQVNALLINAFSLLASMHVVILVLIFILNYMGCLSIDYMPCNARIVICDFIINP